MGIGFGVESQAVRGFSWYRKGPLKAKVMELRLKAQTADADKLFLKLRRGEIWYLLSNIRINNDHSKVRTATSGKMIQ